MIPAQSRAGGAQNLHGLIGKAHHAQIEGPAPEIHGQRCALPPRLSAVQPSQGSGQGFGVKGDGGQARIAAGFL